MEREANTKGKEKKRTNLHEPQCSVGAGRRKWNKRKPVRGQRAKCRFGNENGKWKKTWKESISGQVVGWKSGGMQNRKKQTARCTGEKRVVPKM